MDWYWFTTGVTRAVRKGVASFQENWRTLAVQDVAATLDEITQGAVPQVFVFREILTHMSVQASTTLATNSMYRQHVPRLALSMNLPCLHCIARLYSWGRAYTVMCIE